MAENERFPNYTEFKLTLDDIPQAGGEQPKPAKTFEEAYLQPPIYTIDLSLPPRERYKVLAKDFKEKLQTIPPLFGEVISTLHDRIPVRLILFLAKFVFRRLYSIDENEEIQGISEVAGIDLYLLVAFNVLLDSFMGCTSGGARIRDESGELKMLHFRTLDWGMDVLRKLVVQLDFVREFDGPVIASSVTYVGYVGILTGVRPGLSLSLNFRPTHKHDTHFATCRLRWHQLLVLLGLRRSISSYLRDCLIGLGSTPGFEETKHLYTLDGIEERFPSITSTAAYLIFSDGQRTVTMEKDLRSAVTCSATDIIVVGNNDAVDEPESGRWANAINVEKEGIQATGMEVIIETSVGRTQCVRQLFREATKKYRRLSTRSNRSTRSPSFASQQPDSVTEEDVRALLKKYDVLNEETHFATIMDPTNGKFIMLEQYLDPLNFDWVSSIS
ncbi:hypothetical protein MMC25_001940 [Agyrium rufum]|nr:hypothetical protein [Agyrium rufum]